MIYLGFVSLGLPDGTLGVAWPRMHGDLGLALGLAGPLMLWLTLFSAGSSFGSGAVIKRLGEGPVVLVSGIMTGGALLGIAHAPHVVWLLVVAVPLGLGAGAVDAGLNGYVARHYSGRHMNWLHACWGIGATVGPLAMAQVVERDGGWRLGYTLIGSAQLVLAAVFLATLSWWKAVPTRSAEEAATAGGRAVPTMPANSVAGWLSAVIFALYVAIEMSAGLWVATYLVVAREVSVGTAGLAVSLYFGAITGGRIAVGFVVDRLGNRRVLVAGTLLAIAGGVGLCLPVGTGGLMVAVLILGLGFAPVYPTMMHEVPRRFAPDAVQPVIGRQIGAAYVGGAVVPAAMGWVVQVSGPWLVMLVVAVGAVLQAGLVRWLNRLTPAPTQGSS
ncbi:MFS transporter [Actomonas aquatica]|uniref:MFS transporter n=1 Tax=Actomonas aquatica TaxID=2866162 RepID=A0ABZ1C581_9BACT|nr:MFS transporter [Opitutus sp. WL0086]WRQ85674.1 MFS transporter [Opitutus sp. WL0086]